MPSAPLVGDLAAMSLLVHCTATTRDKTHGVVSPVGVVGAIVKARGVSDYPRRRSDSATTGRGERGQTSGGDSDDSNGTELRD